VSLEVINHKAHLVVVVELGQFSQRCYSILTGNPIIVVKSKLSKYFIIDVFSIAFKHDELSDDTHS
jgi:hypothetical protein